jgi:AcrR family transcriptional regulator
VEDIATEARVAPATVYAVTGGKQGLLIELITTWTSDPIVAATISHIRASRDPTGVVREVAAASRQMREQFADIMRVMLTTAPHDAAVAAQMEEATSVYRAAFVPVAEQLDKLRALRRGIDVAQAVDVLWFYFGYGSYFTLHDENGWSYDRAERWLADQACRELLSGDQRRTK